MAVKERWFLPEGIDEVGPANADYLEQLRRALIDRLQTWGYQFVSPPMVEYLDVLLTGPAKKLELQTFKLIDEMSGRLLGIRADMTPQVARIAAHKLRNQAEILRLCYIGSVLKTRPICQGTSRNPIQLGAEIYGHPGAESDVEIIQLMFESLNIIGFNDQLVLDIGHVDIFKGLVKHIDLSKQQETELFSVVQKKSTPDLIALLNQYTLSAHDRELLMALPELHGDSTVLQQAHRLFSRAPDVVKAALATLEEVAQLTKKRLPAVKQHFDLAELRGYDYHTGIIFSAYQASNTQVLAMGGRYDGIGSEFGHAQPATGFSLDLKQMVTNRPTELTQSVPIRVKWCDDKRQHQVVSELRQQGKVVIYQLEETVTTPCHQLVKQNDDWVIIETGITQ